MTRNRAHGSRITHYASRITHHAPRTHRPSVSLRSRAESSVKHVPTPTEIRIQLPQVAPAVGPGAVGGMGAGHLLPPGLRRVYRPGVAAVCADQGARGPEVTGHLPWPALHGGSNPTPLPVPTGSQLPAELKGEAIPGHHGRCLPQHEHQRPSGYAGPAGAGEVCHPPPAQSNEGPLRGLRAPTLCI